MTLCYPSLYGLGVSATTIISDFPHRLAWLFGIPPYGLAYPFPFLFPGHHGNGFLGCPGRFNQGDPFIVLPVLLFRDFAGSPQFRHVSFLACYPLLPRRPDGCLCPVSSPSVSDFPHRTSGRPPKITGSVSNSCRFTFTRPASFRLPTACKFASPLRLTPSPPSCCSF